MLDAIIIEHRGTLDKVITNLQNGVAGPERIQRLSQDLVKVSEALAALPEDESNRPLTFLRDPKSPDKHSLILEMDPILLRQSTRSVPQLLQFIDAAAADLGLELPTDRDNDHQLRTRSKKDSDTEIPSSRRSRGRRLYLPGGLEPIILTPTASAMNTRPTTPDKTCESPLLDRSIFLITPTTSPPGGLTRLPSEVFRSQDLRPLESSASTPSTRSYLIKDKDVTTGPKVTQGLSRIPSRKRTIQTLQRLRTPTPPQPAPAASEPTASATSTSSKSRPSLSSTSKLLAPYQDSLGGAGTTTSVKPSQVVKMQRGLSRQGTFGQSWLRDSGREATGRERVDQLERRGKVAGADGMVKL